VPYAAFSLRLSKVWVAAISRPPAALLKALSRLPVWLIGHHVRPPARAQSLDARIHPPELKGTYPLSHLAVLFLMSPCVSALFILTVVIVKQASISWFENS
jgi:hypothetical protein